MIRWFALLLLVASSSGCAMMDGYDGDGDGWAYHAPSLAAQPVAPAQSSCATSSVVPATYNQSQTQEPPR